MNNVEKYAKYMLNAKALKHHGMVDKRWSMNDKVDQLRGVVDLYEREKTTIHRDTQSVHEKQVRELRKLRSNIDRKRETLVNSLSCDQQTLKNTLSEFPQLQLAYQNKPSDIILDELKQLNFVKKKELDRLSFRKNKQSKDLLEMKTKLSRMNENKTFHIKEEDRVQELSGFLQSAELKREVAQTINKNFLCILDVMKKDALYFDAVIVSLRKDSEFQGTCLYRTTQLGQLANEYLDDRKQDYAVLELAVKQSMSERRRTIDSVTSQVKRMTHYLKALICKESGTDLTKSLQMSNSELELQRNLSSLDSILKFIQDSTYVSQYDEILPRMQDQKDQYDRLKSMVQDLSEKRDVMLKKRDHVELMFGSISTTMAATTHQYIEQKKKSSAELAVQSKKRQECSEEIAEVGEIMLKIRVKLHHLNFATRCVLTPPSKGKKPGKKEALKKEVTPRVYAVPMPKKVELKVENVLDNLVARYKVLMSKFVELKGQQYTEALHMYQKALTEASNKAHAEEFAIKTMESTLISEVEVYDDPTLLTREDIKKRSVRIVLNCATKEDDQPIMLLPLRGKTF